MFNVLTLHSCTFFLASFYPISRPPALTALPGCLLLMDGSIWAQTADHNVSSCDVTRHLFMRSHPSLHMQTRTRVALRFASCKPRVMFPCAERHSGSACALNHIIHVQTIIFIHTHTHSYIFTFLLFSAAYESKCPEAKRNWLCFIFPHLLRCGNIPFP